MASATESTPLPAAWQAAFERDRAGIRMGANPIPDRRAARLLAAFIAAGLFFLAFPGTLIGVGNLLLIAMERLPTAPRPAWIQAHGQAQVLGWVGSFILGISLFMLPKLRRLANRRMEWGWLAWSLWTAGAIIRWRAGTSATDPRVWLIAAALLFLAGFGLVQAIIWQPARPSPSRDRALPTLAATGFCGLAVALLVNLAGAWMSAAGTGALPAPLDRTLVALEIWAFIVPAAAGFSTRFVASALGLRQHRFTARPLLWLQAGVAILVLAALTQVFMAADVVALAIVAGLVWGLRIFDLRKEPGERAPKREGVYGGYTVFLRIAFAWLCLGAALGVIAPLLPGHPGFAGASRHAVTIGFIVTLIFCVGPRILPSFLNRRKLFSVSLMACSLWLLTAGCLMRVVSEAAAYGA
ncbi:MAG: NnrS family protein, partial [Terriglobales bacterium]